LLPLLLLLLLLLRCISRSLQVREKVQLDGNAAAFFKTVGELAVHAGDLPRARALFAEAVPLFREVKCAFVLRAALFLFYIRRGCVMRLDFCSCCN
jgi:hypothetical protein